jgi:hypothetical protein
MKKNVLKPILILITVTFVTLQSCEKKEIVNPEDDFVLENNYDNLTIEDMPQIDVINGILHFQNNEEYNMFMTIASKLTSEERANYETGINFLSQQRIFEQIIEEELLIDEPYENLTEEEINNITVMPPLHSELYYSYLNSGIIKENNKGTDNEYYELSIFNPAIASVLNVDGIYSVGKSIFQITEESEKEMTNGDFSKICMLKEANTTNEDEDITVYSLNNGDKSTSSWKPPTIWDEIGTGKKGDKRIGLKPYFHSLRVYYSPSGNHKYRTYHNFYVYCQERNWRKKWKYKTTQVWLSGNWRYDEKLHVYNASYYFYFPYASAISTSISPYTGSVSPYETYWVWYYQGHAYDPGELVHASWTATRTGGSSGLTVTYNY